jgi:hypothetical protein
MTSIKVIVNVLGECLAFWGSEAVERSKRRCLTLFKLDIYIISSMRW